MAINKYSFVCSLCEQFYACPEGIVPHRKCKKCKLYYECASCLFCKMAENDISDLLGLSEKLGHFMSEFKMWKCDDRSNFQYPRYGLIVSRKMKTISMRFFQTLIFKLDAFLVRVDDNANIQIIEVIRGNSFKNWRRLPDNYIIYEWTETRFCNQTLKPDKIQKEKEEEQKLREMLAKEKKEEREKRKKQLE